MNDAELKRLAQVAWENSHKEPWESLSISERDEQARMTGAVVHFAMQPGLIPTKAAQGVPVHDEVASVLSLARTWLGTIKGGPVETTIPTATLELLLRTFVESSATPERRRLNDSAGQAVNDRISGIRSAFSRPEAR